MDLMGLVIGLSIVELVVFLTIGGLSRVAGYIPGSRVGCTVHVGLPAAPMIADECRFTPIWTTLVPNSKLEVRLV